MQTMPMSRTKHTITPSCTAASNYIIINMTSKRTYPNAINCIYNIASNAFCSLFHHKSCIWSKLSLLLCNFTIMHDVYVYCVHILCSQSINYKELDDQSFHYLLLNSLTQECLGIFQSVAPFNWVMSCGKKCMKQCCGE